jgi:hypothetical protein
MSDDGWACDVLNNPTGCRRPAKEGSHSSHVEWMNGRQRLHDRAPWKQQRQTTASSKPRIGPGDNCVIHPGGASPHVLARPAWPANARFCETATRSPMSRRSSAARTTLALLASRMPTSRPHGPRLHLLSDKAQPPTILLHLNVICVVTNLVAGMLVDAVRHPPAPTPPPNHHRILIDKVPMSRRNTDFSVLPR